jgi:hypothetical protein
MKKQVLISQPMKGLTNEQIRTNREAVVKDVESVGCEVLDSVFDYESPEYEGMKNKPLFYLAKSFELIASKADAVLFMDGWEEARGCRMEHDACIAYGVPVYYQTVK